MVISNCVTCYLNFGRHLFPFFEEYLVFPLKLVHFHVHGIKKIHSTSSFSFPPSHVYRSKLFFVTVYLILPTNSADYRMRSGNAEEFSWLTAWHFQEVACWKAH